MKKREQKGRLPQAGFSEQQEGTPHLQPPKGRAGLLSWAPGPTVPLEGPVIKDGKIR